MAVRQNANFSNLIGCHGNVHSEIKKAQWDEQAQTSMYQFWNKGEYWYIRFWATGSRKSTIEKITKNIGQIYCPSNKFAEQAKLEMSSRYW